MTNTERRHTWIERSDENEDTWAGCRTKARVLALVELTFFGEVPAPMVSAGGALRFVKTFPNGVTVTVYTDEVAS